jgi:hypothetical protein
MAMLSSETSCGEGHACRLGRMIRARPDRRKYGELRLTLEA